MTNYIEIMIQSAREDRSRFFKKADVYAITNNLGLTSEQVAELEASRQQWRDMTILQDFPDVDWPLPVPSWFPDCGFASRWEKGDKAKWEEELGSVE